MSMIKIHKQILISGIPTIPPNMLGVLTQLYNKVFSIHNMSSFPPLLCEEVPLEVLEGVHPEYVELRCHYSEIWHAEDS
jgi:hypothetical protein